MDVLLANPRGFCAGVDRAIEIVNRALAVYGPPVYVRHEVVHNKFVVDDLRGRGAQFVDELSQVPDGAVVIFSAHGVPKQVQEEAHQRKLQVFDATCPLVTKVHIEVSRYAREGREVILIGHAGHPEVEGTMGQYDVRFGGQIYLIETLHDVAQLNIRDVTHVAFVTQTTLSVDDTRQIIMALQQRFPHIQGPRKDDICYATQNRQDAVRELAQHSDIIIVVGSPNSSNSNRLRELAQRCGVVAYMVDDAAQMQKQWFDGVQRVGVTAGASAPEILIQGVIAQLGAWGANPAQELSGIEEAVVFSLPRQLKVINVT